MYTVFENRMVSSKIEIRSVVIEKSCYLIKIIGISSHKLQSGLKKKKKLKKKKDEKWSTFVFFFVISGSKFSKN